LNKEWKSIFSITNVYHSSICNVSTSVWSRREANPLYCLRVHAQVMRFRRLARNYGRRHTGPSAASATARKRARFRPETWTWHARSTRGSAGGQSDSFKVTTRCHVPRVFHDTTAKNRPSRPRTFASEAWNKLDLACPTRGGGYLTDRMSVVWYWNRMAPDTEDILHRLGRAFLFRKRLIYFDIVGIFNVFYCRWKMSRVIV